MPLSLQGLTASSNRDRRAGDKTLRSLRMKPIISDLRLRSPRKQLKPSAMTVPGWRTLARLVVGAL